MRGEELSFRAFLGGREHRDCGGHDHEVCFRVPGTEVLSLLQDLRAGVPVA